MLGIDIMELKDGIMILINLAILGTVIAAAVYIFQIGDKKRSVSCGAVDLFGDDCVKGCDCITASPLFGQGPTPCVNGTCVKTDNGIMTCKCASGTDPDQACQDEGGTYTCWNDNPDDVFEGCNA